jgi:hypothetical protein
MGWRRKCEIVNKTKAQRHMKKKIVIDWRTYARSNTVGKEMDANVDHGFS